MRVRIERTHALKQAKPIQHRFDCQSALNIGSDSCVDGPLGSRANLRILTVGSIAIMCSAFRRGIMTAGPDGIRDPVPNKVAAFMAVESDGLSGSSVRPIVISLSSLAPAPTRGAKGRRPRPASRRARHHVRLPAGHLVVQSRPKPRGGSIACSSPRSNSTIVRKASAMALSC
jgi:hypothetical protein